MSFFPSENIESRTFFPSNLSLITRTFSIRQLDTVPNREMFAIITNGFGGATSAFHISESPNDIAGLPYGSSITFTEEVARDFYIVFPVVDLSLIHI